MKRDDTIIGGSLIDTLNRSLEELESVFGRAIRPGDPGFNDDEDKVDARFGFQMRNGTVAIWSYKRAGISGQSWSVWYDSPEAWASFLTELAKREAENQ